MTIRESVLNGEIPKGLRIFDAHCHLGEGEYTTTGLVPLRLEQSLVLSRNAGIRAVAAIVLGAMGGDPVALNRWIINEAERYPEEIFFYIYYNPLYHDVLIQLIDRYRDHPNFIGVKIHPREDGSQLGEGDYDRLFDYTDTHGILTLCHTWDTEPMNRPISFQRHLEKRLNLKVLLGHMGGTFQGCMGSIDLAKRYPNVYCDINGSIYSKIWIEELVKLAPVEKLIFSTDQTFNEPRIMVGRVLLSEISDREKEKILCENFENAIGKRLLQ